MTREVDNPLTGSDFDWMVLNLAVWGWKAPVKASVSDASLLSLSPFFASLFPLFSQKSLILRLIKKCHHNLTGDLFRRLAFQRVPVCCRLWDPIDFDTLA